MNFSEEKNVEHREKLIDKEAEKGRYKGAEKQRCIHRSGERKAQRRRKEGGDR